MVSTKWTEYLPHALVVTTVFEFMHIADELAGNWAPFQPFNDPAVATVGMGIFTLVVLGALWGSLIGRRWGFALAGLFGIFFAVVECWHLFDPSNMTALRWAVLFPAQGFGVVTFVLAVKRLWVGLS